MSKEISVHRMAEAPGAAAAGTDAWLEHARSASARRQRLLETYPGEWVAVSDDWKQVYAHGPSYLAVCDTARAQGAVDPLLTKLL
jgi:hypothetical protein